MEPKTATKTRLEEILAEWSDNEPSEDALGTISLNGIHSNVSLATTYPYTTVALGTDYNSTPVSAKIQLNGENADIEVNGWSLVQAVKSIEERLNLLQPNPKLESEWAELHELGEQYRKLEQQIKDKQATWDLLRAMPAPTVD